MLTLAALSLLFLSSNSQTSADQICILGTPADETDILFDGAYTVQNTTLNGNNYYKKNSVGPDMYLYMSTVAENCPDEVDDDYSSSYCWCLSITSDFTTNEDDCEIWMAVNNTSVLPSSSVNPWEGEYTWDDYSGLNVTEQTAGDSCQDMTVTDDCFQLEGANKKFYYNIFDSFKYNGYYRQKGIWGPSYEYTQVGATAYLYISTTAGPCNSWYNNGNVTSDYCWCFDYYEAYDTVWCDIQAPIADTSVSPADITNWYNSSNIVWDGVSVTSVDSSLCEKSAANQFTISLFTFTLSIFSITFLS